MNKLKYILKSLWFYKRQHFAVLLGTIVSTTVLTGALIVGDSVKYSLHELVNLRLGEVEYAMTTGDRYVRVKLANEIGNDLKAKVAPVLQINGIAIQPETSTRVNGIHVYGVDSLFWKLNNSKVEDLSKDETYTSQNLSDRMNLKKGDQFLLRVEKGSVIPANAPFVSDEDQSLALRLTVKDIADESHFGRFSLQSNQVAPYNVFLSRNYIADEMDLSGLANLVLATSDKAALKEDDLKNSLQINWKIEDAGLKLKEIEGKDKYEISSNRVFIDEPISDAVEGIIQNQQQLLTYFVNGISSSKGETPYSFITSIRNDKNNALANDEVVINSWLADDLKVSIGDSIELKYFVIGALRKLVEESKTFKIKDVLSITDSFWDQEMMPEFPGLSDAGSCNEWEAGVPVDFSKIRPKDEDYWKKYKGIPKAMISPETALGLWSNKYGKYTALRFNKGEISAKDLQEKLQKALNPEMINLQFLPVRNEGKRAVNNMVDFGGLFLSLSFFIICAGILLTVLIYSLNLDSRNKETGILLGLGFQNNQILSLRIYESLITIILGGVLGVLGGVLYNSLLLDALNSVWQDVVRTNMLNVHIKTNTLLTGFMAGVFTAMICIVVITRKKLKRSAIKLIQNTEDDQIRRRNGSVSILIALFSVLGTAAIVVYAFVSSLEQNAELLLSAGGLVLIGASAFVHSYLVKIGNRQSSTTPDITALALKNGSRNVKRSLAIVVLLALGTFSVLITGANRKTFYNTENSNASGTGGYEYWIEATLPVLSDLNTSEGQEKVGFWEGDLDTTVNFVQFRALEGDDASCLNLNQVSKPQILGFNTVDFEQRKSFSFAKLHSEVDKENPWGALNQDFGENVIPAIADQTVIVWGLKMAVGDTLHYQNEFGEDLKLLLVGGLANSIFQGNILIADSLFQENFPSVSGSKIILAEGSPTDSLFINKLEENLQDLGVRGSKTSDKLAAFYSVENTYLSMFMFLGGLGVIIGTIGLGIVLLRNVWERKKELALLSAIGYTAKDIFKLLFIENLFLLILGLLCGTAAAFIGVLPSLFSPAFQMPYTYVISLLLAIFVSGLLWILIPIRLIRKFNIIETLKAE